MSDTKTFKLVSGIFNNEDAHDILCHLLDKKINFHLCKILSSFEKSGEEDPYSKNRVEELKATKKALLEMVELAKLTGKNLEVKSDIRVSLSTEATTSVNSTKEQTV